MSTPRAVPHKIRTPLVPGAGLAALWVGHATVLIQIHDRVVLTDPVFVDRVGMVSKRLVEPGLRVDDLPAVDVTLISHMHFDHLSLGTLSAIEGDVRTLVAPHGAQDYVPRYEFEVRWLAAWQSWDDRGMRVTAVPVDHSGFRYGADALFDTGGYTGFVVEYAGVTVYFGGDTAFAPQLFRRARERFQRIDLALLPIAPIEPRAFMESKHVDPGEALDAFELLGARWMLPIHYETFYHGDEDPDTVRPKLLDAMRARELRPYERVVPLQIGERFVFLES